jgi:predicted CopG family antitoxin
MLHKKLTITVEDEVYQELHRQIGRGRISSLINRLIRQHVMKDGVEEAYKDMASDQKRESEAVEWSENLLNDINHETK